MTHSDSEESVCELVDENVFSELHIYPIKTVSFQTCGQLYCLWKARGKRNYRNIPNLENGLTVNVEYADTLGQLDSDNNPVTLSSRTALCLHGAPGKHKD